MGTRDEEYDYLFKGRRMKSNYSPKLCPYSLVLKKKMLSQRLVKMCNNGEFISKKIDAIS